MVDVTTAKTVIPVFTNQNLARNHPAQPDCNSDGTINPGISYANPELLDQMIDALDPKKNTWMTTQTTLEQVEELAPDHLIRLVHPQKLIDSFKSTCKESSLRAAGDQLLPFGSEFFVGPHSFEASASAVAVGIHAANKLLTKGPQNIVVLSGPPHHHSEPEQTYGFCGFNGTAIMAVYLHFAGKPPVALTGDQPGELAQIPLHPHWLKALEKNKGHLRVAVVDTDAHSGNGTDLAFRKHREWAERNNFPTDGLFFCEIATKTFDPSNPNLYRAYPPPDSYPYRPNDEFAHREDLELGTTGEEYCDVVLNKLIPKLISFGPDVIILARGFDNYWQDPVGDLGVTPSTDYRATKMLARLGAPVILTREGGYNPHNNQWGITANMRALEDAGIPEDYTKQERLKDTPFLDEMLGKRHE